MSDKLKYIGNKIVPASQFNIANKSLSPIIRSAAQADVIATSSLGQSVFANPNLLEFIEGKEKLPIIRKANQTLFRDRYNKKVRWYLPTISLKDPKEIGGLFKYWKTEPVLNENGDMVQSNIGTIKLGYQIKMSEKAEKVWKQEKIADRNLTLKAIPLAIKEVKLSIFWQGSDGKEKKSVLTADIDLSKKQFSFELKDSYLKRAYYNLATTGKAKLEVLSDYFGWKPISKKEAKGLELITNKYSAIFQPKANLTSVAINPNITTSTIGGRSIRPANTGPMIASGSPAPEAPRPVLSTPVGPATNVGAINIIKPPILVAHPAILVNPVILAPKQEEQFAKQNFIVRNRFQLSFPCEDYTSMYLFKDKENETSAIGCNPAWGVVEDQPMFKRVIEANFNEFPVRIYQSLAEPRTYLVIPNKYVITRDIANYHPAVSFISALNPENEEENDLQFNIAIGPNISKYQLTQLKMRLADNFSISSPSKVKLIYPSDLDVMPGISVTTHLADTRFGYNFDGFNFLLDFSTTETTDAKVIIEKLRSENSLTGINGTIHFELDGFLNESSVFVLNLNETIGEVVVMEKTILENDLQFNIVNHSESPAKVRGVLFHEPQSGIKKYHAFDSIITLGQEDAHLFTLSDMTLKNSEIAIDYTIEENTSLGLSERRIAIDLMTQAITFSTNVDPVSHAIQSINIEVVFDNGNETISTALIPANSSFAGRSTIASLYYPLDRYLFAPERIIKYRYTVRYIKNGSSTKAPISSDWIDHNITIDTASVRIKAGDISLLESR